MRLLMIPNITKTSGDDLSLDSSFKLLKTISDEFDEDAYFYWILPKVVEGMKTGLSIKRHKIFYEKHKLDSFDFRDDFVDSDLLMKFSRRYGDYVIDAVITRRKGAPLELVKLNDMYRRQDIIGKDDSWIPVFVLEPNAEELNEHKSLINSIAYASSISVFHTELEKKKTLSFMSRFLSGSVLRHARMIVAPLGLKFDKIDEITEDVKRNNVIKKIFYGWRMNSFKGTQEILDTIGYLASTGRDNVEYIATTITGQMTAMSYVPEKWGKYFRLYSNCAWDKYLCYAKSSHVGLVASPSEALGVAFVELLYLGVILIFPNREWVYQIVPKDYPFIYHNKKEMYGLLAYVVDNYEEAYARFEHIPALIREKFSKKSTTHYLVRSIYDYVEKHRNKVLKKSVYAGKMDSLTRTVGFRDQMTWEEFINRAEEFHKDLHFPQSEKLRRRKTMSNYELYLFMLMNQNFKDLCNSEFPTFKMQRIDKGEQSE